MAHNPTHATLVLSAITHISPERLQKAVSGLADGSMTIANIQTTDLEIRAQVQNGTGSAYHVNLQANAAHCNCPDARHRGVVCTHALALALFVLKPAQEKPTDPEPDKPVTHLMGGDGSMLCHEPYPENFWTSPWAETVLTEDSLCKACLAAYQQPAQEKPKHPQPKVTCMYCENGNTERLSCRGSCHGYHAGCSCFDCTNQERLDRERSPRHCPLCLAPVLILEGHHCPPVSLSTAWRGGAPCCA